jgi:hypothetical protein
MLDHDQRAPGIVEKVAEAQVFLVDQHQVRSSRQENEQRASKVRTKPRGNLLKQLAQGIGPHTTFKDWQIDQSCEHVMSNHHDRCQGMQP